MIKFVKGDIFESDSDIIAHGCNARGAFGSGIAAQIKELYPKAREDYIRAHNKYKLKLGDIIYTKCNNVIIANCVTQISYGKMLEMDEQSILDRYAAIKKISIKLKEKAIKNNLSIAMPMIGCGLARGDKDIVSKIFTEVFETTTVLATIYELPQNHVK